MTQQSLSDFARLNNELKQVPRHLMYAFCKLNGIHSPFNGKMNPAYIPCKLQSQM